MTNDLQKRVNNSDEPGPSAVELGYISQSQPNDRDPIDFIQARPIFVVALCKTTRRTSTNVLLSNFHCIYITPITKFAPSAMLLCFQ